MAGPTIKLTFAGDSTDLEKTMGKVDGAADGMAKSISAKGAALAVAGAGLGAAVTGAFMDSMEVEDAAAKLSAQLGAGSDTAKKAGAIAGHLYANAYGDSLGEVGEAVKGVIQSGIVMEDASNEQIEGITGKVMSLAQAFDQDVGGATSAVAQMMKTGLAPNADAALDILTRGFQQGNDKAGDLLDTMNEYSTQFRKLGIDGTMAMGLIQQGLQGGARDADVVADAIKEFSIRSIDGSKSTADGFKTIGLNADKMAKQIAGGGKGASDALDIVLDRLRGMKDPVKQAAAATELFGTQSEDLGKALYSMDPSTAVAAIGKVDGAAQTVNDTLGATASQKITAVKRGFDTWVQSIVGVKGPIGDMAAGIAGMGGDTIGLIGSLSMAVVAIKGLGIGTGIATAAQWLFNAAMDANPIGIIVLAIAALVAGVILAYNNIGWFKDAVDAAWSWIKDAFGNSIEWIKGVFAWFGELPGLIGNWFGGMKDAAIGKATELVNWVRGLPGMIMGAIGNFGSMLLGAGGDLLSGLWNGIANAAGWLKSKVLNFFGSILPGWAKDILGIHSPSTVFADLGQYIPSGLAKGMNNNLDEVSIASARMVSAVVDPFADLADVVQFGSVSDSIWDSLLGAGWKGKADDGMEALYRPQGGTTQDMVKAGDVSDADWESLINQGWKGRADDGMEAIYRPTSSSGAATTVNFTGNTSDALAVVIQNLIRTGKIQIS